MTTALTAANFPRLARRLAGRHPELAGIIERHGLPEFWCRQPGIAALVQIILEQQVSLAAARTVYRKLKTELGGMSGARLVQTGEAGLRRMGLTRQKARYLTELGLAVSERRFSVASLGRLADQAALDRLVALPGIGPWTGSIYLLSALRRPDIWPPGDLALIRAIGEVLPAGRQRTAIESGAPWRPYRAVAARVLWHHYLSR